MPMINNVISTTPDYLQGYVGGYPVNIPVGLLIPAVVQKGVVNGNQPVSYNPSTGIFSAAGATVSVSGTVPTLRIAATTAIPLDTANNGKAMPLVAGQTISITADFTPTVAAGAVLNGVCVVDYLSSGIGNLLLTNFNVRGDTFSAEAGRLFTVTYFNQTSGAFAVVQKGNQLLVAPVFTGQSAPAGTVGTAYSYLFVSTNATSFSVFSGSIPAGLTFNNVTGALTGTPTAAATSAFVISATNAAGTNNSTAQSVVIVTNITVPGQVTALTLGTATSATQPLTWTAPASNGGSALTDYFIEYQIAGAGSYTAFAHSASTVTAIVITGLTASSSYNYRISAINALGTGVASAVSTGSTAQFVGVSATPFFTDTFTGVNGTNLTARLPDLTPSTGWTTPVGSYQISANTAQSATNGAIGAVLLGPDSPTNDYQIRVTFSGASGATSDGPIFRGIDGANFVYAGSNGSPDGVAVKRFIASSEASYINSSVSTTAPRSMVISAVGPLYTVQVNGVLVNAGAISDSVAFNNVKKFGFRMAGTVGANTFDDFNVYSIFQGTPFSRPFSPSAEQVIWDTDMGTDEDDIGAGLLLHGMRLAGEANILCVTTGTRAANSVNAIYAINNYKGVPSIPIGVAAAVTFITTSATANAIATGAYGTGGPGLAVTEAVTLIRQKLNSAANGSVVIVGTGFTKNFADVLASTSNNLGDGILQTGLQLITAKVKRATFMLGMFANRSDGTALGQVTEFNATAVPGSTDSLINNWPSTVPLYFDGYEIGVVASTGIVTGLCNVTRPNWDTSAMVFAVRGTSWGGTQYFALNQGKVFSLNGGVGFIPDSAGNHFVVREFAAPATVIAQINTLAGT